MQCIETMVLLLQILAYPLLFCAIKRLNSMLATGRGTVPEFLGKKQLSVVNWCDPTEIRYAKFSKGMGGMRGGERERERDILNIKLRGMPQRMTTEVDRAVLTNTCLLILK